MSVHPIPFGLSDGKEIRILGFSQYGGDRFSINLCSGQDITSENALHFNPRFESGEVVRNTYNDGWGEEETQGDSPFSQGSPFEIRIKVTEPVFDISVNGSHFCIFAHRLPAETANFVVTEGSVAIYSVTFHDTNEGKHGIHPVPFTLSSGAEIKVYGRPNKEADRFSINLCSGHNHTTDTPLHFNPRFDDSDVVRNTYNDGWGDEETGGDFPFQQGVSFEVKIVVEEDCYRIYVNGSHFADYGHRLPVDIVRNVFVDGDCKFNAVTFQNSAELFPAPYMLSSGKQVTVRGTVNEDAERFSINLCSGRDYESDTALHFNPRFGDDNIVVRNSFNDGWGEEETDGEFPFEQGASYEVRMVVNDAAIQVFVNDSYFCDFGHRMPVENMRNVYIQGDTSVKSVTFDNMLYPVPFSLSEGKEITIRGFSHHNADRFSINLSSGPDFDMSATALHFNPRFCSSEVVRNTFNDGWGGEETDGGFPFAQGEPFEVRIAVREPFYKVYVDGNFFCDFQHRVSKESVRNIYIAGDVTVEAVTFKDLTPVYNPTIGSTVTIPGGMRPGRKLFISGKPHSNPERFNVNLLTGGDSDSADFALHYDARFNYGGCENEVVRTTRTGGSYGLEEKEADYFPFAPDAPFEMIIEANSEFFTILVNNQIHCRFNHHHHPFQHVSHLYIDGDVEVFMVRFELE